MKIAIITNTCYEEIIPLAKHLSKKVEVNLYTLISRTGAGKQLLFEKDDLWNNEKSGVVFDIDKKLYIVDEFNRYINNRFRINAIFFKSLAYFHPKNLIIIKELIAIFKKMNYDLIHFNINTGLIPYFRFFLPKTPIVITVHDPVRHLGEKHILYSLMDRYTLSLKTATYILHSNYSYNLFKKINKNISNSFMIPFGNHEWLLEFKQGKFSEEENLILFVGRVSKYKGIENLIKAFLIVKKQYPKAKLIIAGKGKYWFDTNKYKKNISIEFINRYIPNEELIELIIKSTIVVLPYLEATQSGVVSSVFTFNKPVIATNVGGIPEIVKHKYNGTIVEPNNIEYLADAIKQLLKSEDILNEYKKNIRKLYTQGELSWTEIANKTIKVYTKTIEEFN